MGTRLAARATAMSPPTGCLRAQLSDLVRHVGTDLLRSLGLPALSEGPFDPSTAVWSDPVSFIGFGGPHIAGTLIVAAPWPLMARTIPIGDHRPEALADWSRELCNMALGALKISLLRRGLQLQIGLPTSIVSTDLRIATTSRDPIGQRFACHGDDLLLALDCAVASGLELGAPRDASVGGPGADAFVFL